MHVFFFRGLSTGGRDDLRWGPLDFGAMSKALAATLNSQDVTLHAVLDMGLGPLPQMASRARRFLERHPLWRDSSQPVHFLGHSAGGVITRLLLSTLEREGFPVAQKIRSHVTIATPHHGSALANVALHMPETHPGSALILRLLGYNLKTRRDFFRSMSRASIHALLANTSNPAIPQGSIVCAPAPAEWCRLLKTIYLLPGLKAFTQPSDGFVERESQVFGEILAEIPLDHLRQVGLFDGFSPAFQHMCTRLREFMAQAEFGRTRSEIVAP